jgi:hypothetical protein
LLAIWWAKIFMKIKLAHCSYHKCLTVYFSNVLSTLYNRYLFIGQGYHHFNSSIQQFYNEHHKYKVASINNQSLDLENLDTNSRVTRFIRDPRDLVVSAYYYHLRGAEYWSNVVDPVKEVWDVVNGVAPDMEKGQSFASYLQNLSEEDGLIAEIDFRRKHFESMKNWPVSDPRIKLFHYEDIIGNEVEIFHEIFSHYGVTWLERRLGVMLADRFSASKKVGNEEHIRNPKSGQWKNIFTAKTNRYFEQHHGEILELYGYE